MLPVKRKMPIIPPVFTIGDKVTVIGGRRSGLNGIVVQETNFRVVITDDAGFRHWIPLSDVIKTEGPWW